MSILDEHERVEPDEDVRPRLPFHSFPPTLLGRVAFIFN